MWWCAHPTAAFNAHFMLCGFSSCWVENNFLVFFSLLSICFSLRKNNFNWQVWLLRECMACSHLPCLQHHLSRPTTEQQEGIISSCAAMTFKVRDPWTLWSNLLCVHIKWDQPPLLSLKVPTFIPGPVLAKCFVKPQFWPQMCNSVPCPLRVLATYCVPVLCTLPLGSCLVF